MRSPAGTVEGLCAASADEGEAKLALARRAFLAGVVGIWFAVAFSLLGPHGK